MVQVGPRYVMSDRKLRANLDTADIEFIQLGPYQFIFSINAERFGLSWTKIRYVRPEVESQLDTADIEFIQLGPY